MTNFFIKNWQITFLIVVIILAVALIGAYGVKLGMDFKGGTLYQIELQKPISSDEINRIANIISKRIDPSGLKDATVSPVGSQFIIIQLAETSPVELEKIEARIRQQGKFESNLNGEVVFTGDEIKKVERGSSSFGVFRATSTLYEWSLPFILNEKAALSFKEKTFHQCNATSFSTSGTPVYDCAKTVFFLDKPSALIVTTEEQYTEDADLLTAGNPLENIPQSTNIDDFIRDTILPVIVIDNNKPLDMNLVNSALTKTNLAVVSPDVSQEKINDLNALGFTVTVTAKKESIPWIWSATNARQIISLTEGITNEDVADISQAKEFTSLRISGQRASVTEARADLEELAILLESGSLPTPVKSISRETVSPSLGSSFLNNIILMGLLAAITVAVIIIIRYRNLKLAIPIFLTGMAEIVIMMGFLAVTQRPLDLAAFAGLIAAIGTGVDSEIVITDEVMGKAQNAHESLIQRAKNALFIIGTSAFTIIAVMGPIVLLSRNFPGLDKLYGFAVVTIVGSLIGIIITRPGYTKIVEMIVHKKETDEHNHAHHQN
ncbi:Protein-export membrane protein SecD [uncultured archaeon]|nr:Protein-export membrane protein SecD [uncultured archaeon]